MSNETTALAPRARADVQEAREEVEFVAFGQLDRIKLNVTIVQTLLCKPTKQGHLCSRQDAIKFMMMCRAKRLNPFEGDAFLVGYDSQNGPEFSLITAHQAFLKRAECHEHFDGMSSGVIIKPGWDCPACEGIGLVKEGDKLSKCPVCHGRRLIDEVEGDVVPEEQQLVGGWAHVVVRNRSIHTHRRISLNAYRKPTKIWNENPAGQIVKCAEADALRSTFPTLLGGLYAAEEGVDLLGRGDELKASADLKNLTTPKARRQIQAPPAQPIPFAQARPEAEPARRGPTLVEEPLTPDEKAEADMGLAPALGVENTTRTREQGAGSGQQPAIQDQLAQVVTSAGFTFDQFAAWGQTELTPETCGPIAWDDISGFGDMPDRAAKFCVRAKVGMLNALRGVKGGGQ